MDREMACLGDASASFNRFMSLCILGVLGGKTLNLHEHRTSSDVGVAGGKRLESIARRRDVQLAVAPIRLPQLAAVTPDREGIDVAVDDTAHQFESEGRGFVDGVEAMPGVASGPAHLEHDDAGWRDGWFSGATEMRHGLRSAQGFGIRSVRLTIRQPDTANGITSTCSQVSPQRSAHCTS